MFCKSCRLFDFKTSTRPFFCINRIFIHLKDRVNARAADCGVFSVSRAAFPSMPWCIFYVGMNEFY